MAIEIERKFLVLNENWKSKFVKKEFLRDGLIATEDSRKVRVRTYDDRATLTIKGLKVGLKREEYEYEIPLQDAEDLFTRHCGGRILEKTRYYVPYFNHMWTVDTYHGLLEGHVLAEIELPLEQTGFDAPDWLGEEVTHDRRYSKINLLKQKSVAEEKIAYSKVQKAQTLGQFN